jgi:hypothetical protein
MRAAEFRAEAEASHTAPVRGSLGFYSGANEPWGRKTLGCVLNVLLAELQLVRGRPDSGGNESAASGQQTWLSWR